MKPSNRSGADRKRPAPTAGASGPRPRDLRIAATTEQLAAVIGAAPPKAAHKPNYLRPKPMQSESKA